MTYGEVAVLVQDGFQGKGLGSKFVEMLIGIARERGSRLYTGRCAYRKREDAPRL